MRRSTCTAQMPLRAITSDGFSGPAMPPSAESATSHAKACLFRRDHPRQVGAADLLLALKQEGKVHGRSAIRARQRLDRLDQREQVGLHIGRTAGVDVAVADRRFERRRLPERDRVDRLDVEMAVDQHGRLSRRGVPAGDHVRMTGGGRHLDLGHAGRAQPVGHPPGRARHVVRVLRRRAHTRDSQELEQLGELLVTRCRQLPFPSVVRGHRKLLEPLAASR